MEGAQAKVQGEGLEALSGHVNYFKGNDRKKWLTDIPTFARVTFPKIYPGIDLSYHETGGHVENDFIVSPGSDPSGIHIRFDGADKARVTGRLTYHFRRGSRAQLKKPLVYQATATGRKKPVEARFRQDSRMRWDRGGRLRYHRDVGHRSRDHVCHIFRIHRHRSCRASLVTDASGNAYIVGGTDDQSYPIKPSSTYSLSIDGALSGDVIVSKMNASGTALVFSTHIGGGLSNTGVGIALDGSGNIYVTGMTASPDFPTYCQFDYE